MCAGSLMIVNDADLATIGAAAPACCWLRAWHRAYLSAANWHRRGLSERGSLQGKPRLLPSFQSSR